MAYQNIPEMSTSNQDQLDGEDDDVMEVIHDTKEESQVGKFLWEGCRLSQLEQWKNPGWLGYKEDYTTQL